MASWIAWHDLYCIFFLVSENLKSLNCFSTDSYPSPVVFGKGANRTVARGMLVIMIGVEDDYLIPVVPVEPVNDAKTREAAGILQNSVHFALRQTFFRTNVMKARNLAMYGGRPRNCYQ